MTSVGAFSDLASPRARSCSRPASSPRRGRRVLSDVCSASFGTGQAHMTGHSRQCELSEGTSAMGQIASEVLIQRLADWGVDTIFGLPGDGINGIMEGLRRHGQGSLRPRPSRGGGRLHGDRVRQSNRAPGRLPGHLGTWRHPSTERPLRRQLDHAPSWPSPACRTQMLGTGYQQEVPLEKLFIDVAEYNQMIRVPAQLPTLLDIASCRLRAPGRGAPDHPDRRTDRRRRRRSVAARRAGPARPRPECRGLRPASRSRLQRPPMLNAGKSRHAGRGRRPARQGRGPGGGRGSGRPDREDAARQGGRSR